MSHFAKVYNGIVCQVIVAEPEFFKTFNDPIPGDWVQTSYNTRGNIHYDGNGIPDGGIPMRKNYAGIGYSYNKDLDAFIPPKPYASWILDEETCLWNPPVSKPSNGVRYLWDEEVKNWISSED